MSKIQVNDIVNHYDTGAPQFPKGIAVGSGATLGLNVGTGASIYSPSNNVLTLGTNSSERIRIKSDGDVFIGNISHSNDNGVVSNYRTLTLADTTNGAQFHLRGQSPKLFMDVTGGGTAEVYYDTGNFTISSGEPGNVSNTERLRITSAGLVGINTTPGTLLELKGESGKEADVTFNRQPVQGTNDGVIGQLLFENATDSVAQISVKRESAADDAYIQFATQTTGGSFGERLRITSGGNVEIGSNGNYGNSPATLNIGSRSSNIQGTVAIARGEAITGGTGPVLSLVHGPDGGTQRTHQIYSFTGDLRIVADSNENMEFHTGGSESLRLRSNGDLIIGPYDAPGAYTTAANNVPYSIKVAPYGWQHHSELASISMGNHSGSTGNDDGEIVFKTTLNAHSSTDGLTEKLRINSWNDIYANANFRINAPDVYYTATFTMDSTWTSYQTIAANLAADSVYLVSINWIHGTTPNQPYYYTTSFLYHTCAGTNGTGAENEKTFMHSTHTGSGTGYLMTFRGKATSAGGGGNTGSNIQAKLNSTWPGLTSGNKLRVAINRLMDGTRSFG